MGGGGKNKAQETTAQKSAAEVANRQWSVYQNDLKGFEDNFIQRVDNYNSSQNMAKTKQDTDLAYAKSFSDSRSAADKQLTASGIDPSSSKYQQTMADISTEQAIEQADTVNRAQTAEQDKHMAGLQDVTAIGMGQKSESLASMGNIATSSMRKAAFDAQNAFNRRSANNQLIGTVAGAGVSAGLRGVGSMSSGSSMDGISTMKSRPTYDHETNSFGTMLS
ncbi:hypothetical protein [Photobacterium kishitanii]|uniref:Uncharacterized protein n=1 Tax=Photobacterium kishitanii TaxID=318456 RepID=A0A2T3KEG6_9GAMM|nr:hypothetical protein [Photobacterium kishitanii]PSU86653.1 hypothetical protein C0W42_19755 [Photobacterium kishitanii]PSU95731.1 hypothetical protein C9J27_17820 [Photobacterium kishitanii]PSV11651.1 hypothetical protein C0W59_19145 [Photobacterium kishitanii]